ncbi:MAG: tatC [Firmicutes bacterium]|nr:tatC [Bacillota bacterium]
MNNQYMKIESADVGNMSLFDHLQELRRRLIICIGAVLVTSTGCYMFAEELVRIITAPAGKLYYMNPAEAFFAYLKVALLAGILLALPLIFYHIWAFVMPAFAKTRRTASFLLVTISLILFLAGLVFSYFLVLPAGIKFFMGFATEDLQPVISIGQYISMVISFLLPFGFIFELPLFIIVAAHFEMISSGFLVSKRKMVIVLSFVIGAIVAPSPDVFSQAMVAIPLLVLYEISIVVVKYILHK